MQGFENIQQKKVATTKDALLLFDQLEAPDLEWMAGYWKGSEFPTNHSMDGLLNASGWYGKAFKDPEHVHPLLFYKSNRKGLFAINPGLLPLKAIGLPLPRNKITRKSILAARLILQTGKFKARLRMIEYRGKLGPAMVYDDQPIIDIFRKLDDQRLLGIMDMKGMHQPFFFVLERDTTFGF